MPELMRCALAQEEEASPCSSVISRGSLEACQEPQHNLPVSQTTCWTRPTNTSLPMPAAVSYPTFTQRHNGWVALCN